VKPAASIRQGYTESGTIFHRNHRNHLSPLPAVFLAFAALFAVAFSVVTIPTAVAVKPAPRHAESTTASLALPNLPLNFEENRGQSAGQVRFISRGGGYALFLTDHETVLSLRRPGSRQRDVLRTRLFASNPDPRVEGQERVLPQDQS
jgi:hypothetical protein